jgi:DNA polymerase-3 subunit delta'
MAVVKSEKQKPNTENPSFKDIVGQDHPLSFLKNALSIGQLPHAFLFLGIDGIGKTSTAMALAQALNCEQRGPDQDACGQCRSCRRFAGGNHPDFQVISPDSESAQPQIKIEQIRELRRQLGFRPLAGQWRVVLVKPAEAMNEPAANALLKTLEEPPQGNLLILTAVSEANLLPTIVSRCRKLTFAPLPPALVVLELIRRRGLDEPQARLAAAITCGSLGQALQLELAELLEQRDQAVAVLAKLQGGTASEILDWAAASSKKNPGLERFFQLAYLWYRDLLALQCGAPAAGLVNQDRLEVLTRDLQGNTPEAIFSRIDALSQARRHLRGNLNVELTLDRLGFQLRQFEGEFLRK